MELAKRSVSLNSLWSVVYCFLVLSVHSFVTYLGVAKYRRLNDDELWGGETPSELRAYIALIVLAILFLPLFVFTSLLKVGNSANDGTKLGRDHALDSTTNTIGAKISHDLLRHVFENFPPFSSVFHILSAFLVLIPEMILTAGEVKHGITPSVAVWTCDMDFLFDSERATMSNIIGQSNVTVLANISYYVVPTPRPPVGGWTRESSLHAAFVYFAAGLFGFSVRYAAVFWFTNKVLGLLFAVQLLFMTVESLFAYCGVSVLYKLSYNMERFEENMDTVLSPGAIFTLYILGGLVLLFSSMIIFNYGANYFQEKFKIIDKRHHPEAYRKQTVFVLGSCQGYKPHTTAVLSLVLLACFRGPILYDLVTVYRVTKDNMILSCIIIDVCYMVFWVILWTILTLKQKWKFRILDYVPLDKPVFMISNENMVKSASYHGGSVEIISITPRKRPSSLPSDMTTSESGFGDQNSSEDERERFEMTLPTLAEDPGSLVQSRRKGSTHSLDRRCRSRRNGNQRVTFHETVKRSTSTDDELFPSNRYRRDLNIAADVHRNSPVPRPFSPTDRRDRPITPIELEILRGRRPGSRHSIGATGYGSGISTINNKLYKQGSYDSELTGRTHDPNIRVKDTNSNERPVSYNDFTIKNDYTADARSNLKSSNIQTQTNLNNVSAYTNNNPNNKQAFTDARTGEVQTMESPAKDKNQMFPNNLNLKLDASVSHNRLSPRTIEFIDKKHEIGLKRRDSANYSLTSSQDTASNESDQNQTQQVLCSQV